MCVPLAVAAGVVSAAGSLVSGTQSLMQGNYEANLARQNAAMEREAARDSIMRGRDEARDFYRRVGQVKGEQRAAMAANGIDTGFGTAGAVQDDTQMLADEDAASLYKNIGERTRGFDINAANFVAEGRAAKQRGRNAMLNSVFEAGSSLMGGFQQHRGLQARLGRTVSSASPVYRVASRGAI